MESWAAKLPDPARNGIQKAPPRADRHIMSPRRRTSDRDRRELEVLHRVAVALSQSLSTSEVLSALTRELVFGVERASECAISLWDEGRDMLIDAAAYTIHGAPAWP